MKKIILGQLILIFGIFHSTQAAIIPSDRLPLPGTWESAGVEGGIPNRPACSTVISAGASVATIQSALNSSTCDGKAVVLPAGTYSISSQITIPSNRTLRGSGSGTIFQVTTGNAIQLGAGTPWPMPKVNSAYKMSITGGTSRGSKTVNVGNASAIPVGGIIQISEEDDTSLVFARSGSVARFRASLHKVESKTATSVTFRPALPIDYSRAPELAWFPYILENAGIENIKFIGNGANPTQFIRMESAWNCWVKGCEFTNMPTKTVVVQWCGHIELRKNYMHDQSNGGSNSEGLDLLTDVSWSLVVDNISNAAGYPAINIGDGGSDPIYSGGFGNVIAYNYAMNAYFTDPPTSTNPGKMCTDICTNHSPHNQYNLVEGNYMGKFGSDAYHGSGSHTVVLRNVMTGKHDWPYVGTLTCVQIDKRNQYYSLVGNVLGRVGVVPNYDFVTTAGWSGSTVFRLGFPDIGNDGFSGTYPPTALVHGDGGPRDLYVDRNNAPNGTTIIEGNWDGKLQGQDWTITPETIPNSYFLSTKPGWFGNLTWPPVDPANPSSINPSIIPAGYRYTHSMADPPGVTDTNPTATPHPADINNDFLMSVNEATKYAACWKNPAAFGDCPSGIAIEFAVRAGTLWNATANGQYQYNSANACPLCWEVKP